MGTLGPDEPPVFDARASEASKLEAMARVDKHAEWEWKVRADYTIYRVSLILPYVSTDPVRQFGDLEGAREMRALGPRMLAAAKRGILEKVGEEKTRVKQGNQHPHGTWKSLIYVPNPKEIYVLTNEQFRMKFDYPDEPEE